MSQSDRKIWTAVLAYLRENKPALCRKWFEDIEPLGIHGGAMDLCAKQTAHRDYLAGKCVDAFNDAFQNATGRLVSVRFLGPDDLPPSTAKSKSRKKTKSTNNDQKPADHNRNNTRSVETTGPKRPAMSHSAKRAGDDLALNADYTFESFVQGPNNRLAHAAAMSICEQPGRSYNPLFVWGASGLGKTHLLQAICQRILESTPGATILYISCEGFITRFLEAVHDAQMDNFRHRFRDVDVLVVDDIHFLTDRERTQEEFFHTFNDLHLAQKQIILSSDREPSQIPELQERLVSRFASGLVAPIDPPDYETRIEIVRNKAKMRGASVPDDVAAFIASRHEDDVRKLEGDITRVQVQASTDHQPINLDLAKYALGAATPKRPQPGAGVTIQAIVEEVTTHFNVTLAALQSKRRQRSIAEPRQVCMFLAREYTRFSLEEIGGYFGGRDHTTVLHAVRTITKRRETDEHLAAAIDHIKKQLAGEPAEVA